MANISQIKLPEVNTPYDIEDSTARSSITNMTLDGLSNVNISNPSNGQVIGYNGNSQEWENMSAGSGSGDMTKSVYDTNDDGIVNESDVADSVKFSKTGGDISVSFGVENNKYGYYDENNTFVDFKSQADIDSAVAAAKVGTATQADVLSGVTFTNSTTSGLSGSMTNNGAVSPSGLNCGGSYTIPAGYHNGSGRVTANSLASQTGVDRGKTAVTAGTMVSGYQGWVNGSKVSGTFTGQEKSTTASRYNQTITPDNGYYLTKVSIAKYPDATGTFTPSSSQYNTSAADMGATNNLRYVNTSVCYSAGWNGGVGYQAKQVLNASRFQGTQISFPSYIASAQFSNVVGYQITWQLLSDLNGTVLTSGTLNNLNRAELSFGGYYGKALRFSPNADMADFSIWLQ